MKTHLLTLALALASTINTQATERTGIFPNPQQETVGGTAFDSAGATFRISGADSADADAVRVLNEKLDVADSGAIEIVIGEKGDPAVSAFADAIPGQAQGYYLKSEPGKVIIAGTDPVGTYYGVQSFLQLMQKSAVPSVEVKDWPDNPVRGIVEGYYGNPWSQEDRLDMMREFMPHARLNLYIYGPKDDPYHKSEWASAYPADKAAQISELATEGLKNKVHFVWAMHPGNSIEGDNLTKAVDKFNKMYDLGVRQFAVFFDDISNYDVNKQVAYLNHINAEVVKKHSDVAPLIVCPSQYNRGWSGNGDYHATMGANLDSDIEVMWTGAGVVDIKLGDASRWYSEKAGGRKPLIWENYPVNDYGYSVRPLMMSPYPAPDADINTLTTGITSNPMEYYYASKVALYGMGDFTWNQTGYNDWQSWEKALGFIMPDHKEAFKTFCYSSFYYPANTHGLVVPYEETPDFKALIDGNETYSASAYEAYFNKQVAAGSQLLEANTPLTAEINEFLNYYKIQGERGLLMGQMRNALDQRNAEQFVQTYQKYDQLTDSASNIVSRADSGIKTFPANCGNLYVEPFITSTVNDIVSEFRQSGLPFDPAIFPAQSIPDGNYLIKVDGAWLSNGSGSAANSPEYPTFRKVEDNINASRQAWQIRYDMNTGRFAICSAHDNRYVNEKGNFGTNKFESIWHTYEIVSLNGKFAIRNAGSAGDNYWTKSGVRLQKGGNAYNPDDIFIFDIEAVGNAAVRDTMAMLPVNTPVLISNDEGKILRRNGNNLNFVDRPESLNSYCQFIIVPNANGRFELRMASNANPYVNEHGVIGTNEFSADWNTYEIYERNGKFAIRNSVDVQNTSRHEYWLIDGDNLSISGTSNIEAYVFTITPLEKDAIDEITVDTPGSGDIYDLQGRRVVNPRQGIFIINGKKIKL